MVRKLKYKGRNGSKGLIAGKLYDAVVRTEDGYLVVQLRNKAHKYGSIREFRKDWDIVE